MQNALFGALKKPFGFLFNVIVIASALVLPFTGLTLLENVRPLSEQLTIEPEISLFLRQDLPREQAVGLDAAIRKALQKQEIAAKLLFIPREQALNSLKGTTDLAKAVSVLGTNPLPDAYVVKLDGFYRLSNAATIEQVASSLRTFAGVEHVQIDSAWIKRLASFLNLAKMSLLFLAVMLGIIVVAVIFNTIRLQMMSHEEEIELSRLMGATDSYIYRPYYYNGILLGLCAGIVGVIIVYIVLHPLNAAVTHFASLYASSFQLQPPTLFSTLLLFLISGLLGLVAAVICTRRYLPEPR
jgi:cell division transport system permease protein